MSQRAQTILAAKCLHCHGPDKAEGGLRLDSKKHALAELDSGNRAIVPNSLDQSQLLVRVASADVDLRMPPDEELTSTEVDLLGQWIMDGATWRVHWAYQSLDTSPPPMLSAAAPIHNSIDLFVIDRLQRAAVEPAEEADRYTLIRRLYYDLLGLPPDPNEVDIFTNDTSALAYERLVDRLLASPQFGERWGRHWLDKARYADSDGYEKDNHRPDAWRYRDWVIAAINEDMPFDQFTIEQLAGDLLPAATPLQRLATAFNRQTLTNTEGGTDNEQWRVAAVMDRVETLGTVWLGLSVGCARCHNHKYDQISQQEYYQLFAYFNNADEVNSKVLRSSLVNLAASSADQPPGDSKQPANEAWMDVRVLAQRSADLRETHILRRGEFKQPLEAVRPGTLSSLPPMQLRADDAKSDRLALAHWLVDGQNPLVPRVAANHIWKHLFGQGLVPTMNDFGVRGDPPSHPELLDHLANQLVASGWSRKQLVKYIVMSATYRQSSRHRLNVSELDPNNRLLHRQNRFRVEAEIVRDISLAASGLLSKPIGGPSVFPPIPASVTDLTYNSGFKWQTSSGSDRYRRGMYTYFKRTAPHPNLTTFDCPDSNVTNVERDRSNTPIAALVTLNNETFVETAQALTQLVWSHSKASSDAERMQFALRRCIARVPSEDEVAEFMDLLTTCQRWYDSHPNEAVALVGAYRISNLALAENAAWVATVRMMLNLDEFLTRE
ncbi:MAG: PSD1 domain-containing protein [Planctomycetales bacterium]|nr:PSD1 domain-containing protein [Planctomycetales bacterium]